MAMWWLERVASLEVIGGKPPIALKLGKKGLFIGVFGISDTPPLLFMFSNCLPSSR